MGVGNASINVSLGAVTAAGRCASGAGVGLGVGNASVIWIGGAVTVAGRCATSTAAVAKSPPSKRTIDATRKRSMEKYYHAEIRGIWLFSPASRSESSSVRPHMMIS